MAADVFNYVTPGYWADGYAVSFSSITAEIQKLAPSSIIEMFEIDASAVGGSIYRFHAGKNNLYGDVIWNGLTYSAFPMEVNGFEWSGKGQLPRPTMTVSNVLGTVTALVLMYDDLAGCKVTRIRTLAKFLDAANFEVIRTNLMFPSSAITGWAASPGSSVAVTANAATSPDGTINATKLSTNDTATNGHLWYKTYTGTINTAYCGSVYLKAGEYSRAQISFDNSGFATPTGALFDLANGIVVATGGGSTATITLIGNGWYRCSITGTTDGDGGNYVFGLTPAPSSMSSFNVGYTSASIGLGVYVYGVQVETGSIATTYVPTTTAAVTSGGNPTADPTAEFARDIYYIDRKSAETRDTVQFELAAALDLAGISLPRRQVIQNYCPWTYRSSECGYTGTSYFDTSDASVGTLAQDVCGKRLTSCRARFGQYAELPYGGFPAAGLLKV